jgi:hypothetical protein
MAPACGADSLGAQPLLSAQGGFTPTVLTLSPSLSPAHTGQPGSGSVPHLPVL